MIQPEEWDNTYGICAVIVMLLIIISIASFLCIFIGLIINNHNVTMTALTINMSSTLMIIMLFLVLECLGRGFK